MGKARIAVLRLGSAALFAFLLASCIHYYRRHTPDEVRQAIVDADIVGATPEEAIRKLRAISFKDGRRLTVGEYNPERYLVEATLTDAMRTWISGSMICPTASTNTAVWALL